uniref:peptidylprolyl isomerase n=1 Tax=Macrostomum lignano TaxID=282301 RepID=A0A1I8FHW7_9PLAT
MPSEGGAIEAPSTRLNQPIHRRDVLSNDGVEFSVPETEEDPEIELVQGLFRDREYLRRMEQVGISDDEDDDDAEDDASGVSRFERKRRTMTDVFPDPGSERHGLLHKRTWTPSRTRKRLNSDMIPGIDWALASMCKGERAVFHIHPDAFLGEQGAAPRIPGGEPILADVELPLGGRVLFPDEDERRKVPFRVQLGVVQNLRHNRQRTCSAAACTCKPIKKYRAAEQVLTSMNVTSEEPAMNRELSVISVNEGSSPVPTRQVPVGCRANARGPESRDDAQTPRRCCGSREALCSMASYVPSAADRLQGMPRDSRRRLSSEFSADRVEKHRRNMTSCAEIPGGPREWLYRRMVRSTLHGGATARSLNNSSSGMTADQHADCRRKTGRSSWPTASMPNL